MSFQMFILNYLNLFLLVSDLSILSSKEGQDVLYLHFYVVYEIFSLPNIATYFLEFTTLYHECIQPLVPFEEHLSHLPHNLAHSVSQQYALRYLD